MKLYVRTVEDTLVEVDSSKFGAYNNFREAVIAVNVYDDVMVFLDATGIQWASYDEPEYHGMARNSATLAHSIASVLGKQWYDILVEFDEDDEESGLDIDWQWSDICEFIFGK